MKPTKSIELAKSLDGFVVVHQYDNGEGAFFYQLETGINSDTGSTVRVVIGPDDFDPSEIGTALIRLEKL